MAAVVQRSSFLRGKMKFLLCYFALLSSLNCFHFIYLYILIRKHFDLQLLTSEMKTFARTESAYVFSLIFLSRMKSIRGVISPVYALFICLFIYLFTFFFQMGVVYTCTRITVNVSQSYFPFYLTETLHFQKVRWTEHSNSFFSVWICRLRKYEPE